MNTMFSAIKTFVADENGVTAIEYGLIAALIGVAMATVAKTLGSEIKDTFQDVVNALTGTTST
ncbi:MULTISPECIES: Flp family type IVb pilin [unclassified Massilia]|jgi:pilus assembly protein Flp/PilA|uniref:Flp family type IVb pilin n=1 Tax=unclassified Massilia TaxID=2609279 RepID=UPI001E464710|nr:MULTISPECIES: Flp family type IVb pilin [unclassified Massilia]